MNETRVDLMREWLTFNEDELACPAYQNGGRFYIPRELHLIRGETFTHINRAGRFSQWRVLDYGATFTTFYIDAERIV